MKKSKQIMLCLLIVSMTACTNEHREKQRLHYRADTNVRVYNSYHSHSSTYVHFYPYGVFHNGTYTRSGYYNSRSYNTSVSHNSPTIRGGMGRTGRGGFSIGT
jgi:hypothetical protein